MIAVFALIALARATTFTLGSAVTFTVDASLPDVCTSKFTIPANRAAAADCMLHFTHEAAKISGEGSNLKIFSGADATIAKLAEVTGDIPCGAAGERHVSVTGDVATNVGVFTKVGGNIVVDVGLSSTFRTGPIELNMGQKVFLYFEAVAGQLNPEFDIDRATTDANKNVDVFFATAETADPATGSKVTLSTTLRTEGIALPAPGKYVLAIVATADSTNFNAKYYAVAGAPDAEYANAACINPCSSDDCATCVATPGCVYCAKQVGGLGPGSCSTGVDQEGKECGTFGEKLTMETCPKSNEVNDACKKLTKSGCGGCTAAEGCIWCDSTGFSGSCSAGQNNLGEKCNNPATNALSKPEECPENDRCKDFGCKQCVEDPMCNFCDNQFPVPNTCQTASSCTTGGALRTNVGECDPDEECELDSCGDCLGKEGCIWCETVLGGSCSAGSDGMGMECKTSLQTPVTDVAMCPVPDPCKGKGCKDCTADSECNFCSSFFKETCQTSSTCSTGLELVETCPADLDCEFDDCTTCLENSDKCVWCDSGFGGSCSAGKDGLAKECKSPLTKPATECSADEVCGSLTCTDCVAKKDQCVWCDSGLGGSCSGGKDGLGKDCKSPAATPATECTAKEMCSPLACSDCIASDKCVWCAGTLSSSCSAGKDNAGKECGGAFSGDLVTDPSMCPSSASTVVASMITIMVASLF